MNEPTYPQMSEDELLARLAFIQIQTDFLSKLIDSVTKSESFLGEVASDFDSNLNQKLPTVTQ